MLQIEMICLGPFRLSRSVTVRVYFNVYLLQIETFESPLRENLDL